MASSSGAGTGVQVCVCRLKAVRHCPPPAPWCGTAPALGGWPGSGGDVLPWGVSSVPLRVWGARGACRDPSVCQAGPGGHGKGQEGTLVQGVLPGATPPPKACRATPGPGGTLPPCRVWCHPPGHCLSPRDPMESPVLSDPPLVASLSQQHPVCLRTAPQGPSSQLLPQRPSLLETHGLQVPAVYSCSLGTPPQRGPGKVLLPRHLRHSHTSLCSRVLCDRGVRASAAA